MLIAENKKALGLGQGEGPKTLVQGRVPVFCLLQHNAHDDDVIDRLMLQEVHLQCEVISCNQQTVQVASHLVQLYTERAS